MNRISKYALTIFMILCLLFTMAACIAPNNTDNELSNSPSLNASDESMTTSNDTTSEKLTGYNDGIIGGNADAMKNDSGFIFDSAFPEDADGVKGEADGLLTDGMGDGHFISPDYFYGGNEGQYEAGTLTAGEWRDTNDLDFWRSLFEKQEWAEIRKIRELYSDNVITVTVTDGFAPVYNQLVELLDKNNELVFSAKSDIHGSAYLCYPDKYKNKQLFVRVGEDVTPITAAEQKEMTVTVSDNQSIEQLDLMLMIDTTGSMGDELKYIETELVDMVERIADAGKTLSIRVSVNFYRDEGDAYVVKYYDFREDINECLEQIKQEYAYGGGDYPEAVHLALENAVTGHTWREDAVKICFFVLDAPPHSEQDIQGINQHILLSLQKAAEQGIRIVPIASSGVDKETEIILRSFAVMTGGTYVFLTDDSGIGNSHLEPTIGEYIVESLNECMIRIVCEYCGLEYSVL